ncbi:MULTISPECIES: sigma-70 family RNA polymerase sigma factor [Bacillaceae]|uniref:sigma-70 family RNA polymerase sigma factor n=1 Tax=Bacillaceae TaxID=186817 RepID=UPI002964D997|nr:sigma-70 family RNA polymerase sigma factor [Bacillus infantis]MDW2876587.1 sigma-70 family RNA polymerase sigma factor [Bacillus infantis]
MENFELLAEQYQPMIRKIIRTLSIYKNEDEFLQIGLIALWEAHKNFRPEKGEFTNFAYTTIKGKFLTEMTRTNREAEHKVYAKEEFWENIEGADSRVPFEKKLILSYCGELTDNQTKWVLYTVLEDLTVPEIAERERVSLSAVKAWRKGAKERLKGSREIFS